jgi:hypothetical protein
MKHSLALVLALFALTVPPTATQAQGSAPSLVVVSALAYEDPLQGRVDVRIVYFGSPFAGAAVATYTYVDGRTIQDEMADCALTDANGVWSISCRNPHYVTWDGLYRNWYAVSSDRVTNGRLMHFQLVGPVSVSARYGTTANP